MARHKYIFVIGGVISGVGKGIAVSSIATIIQARGFRVSPIKFDPYLNVDAGTMNPIEHGEVFVLDSGLETDQDMGNYERFLGQALPAENYMTNGMIYKAIIDRERALGYGGKCVEPVYNVTEEILLRIEASVNKHKSDITIVEIGGIVGEYQNGIFIEAARILKSRNPEDVMFVVVSYLPVPGKIGEMKTRPTQNAVRALSAYGVNADMVIARSTNPLDKERKAKIAFATNVPKENIISAPDVENIYQVPLNFEKDGLSDIILKTLKLKSRNGHAKGLTEWSKMARRMLGAKSEVHIAMVGKYFKTGDYVLSDVYISVIESLKHAAGNLGKKINIEWLDSSDFESTTSKKYKGNLLGLKRFDGIIVPGGFGARGIEGKINVIQYAREHKIPYLGLCYGMQLAVIEYARHVLGLGEAHTTEIDKATKYPVIDVMTAQAKLMQEANYGGSMRLGAYPAHLHKGTLARKYYNEEMIHERHRHRYEVNPEYVKELTKRGLVFSGTSPDGKLMEILELPKRKHPFFMATQFHPEFKTSPLKPHPLFREFIKASSTRSKKK